MQLFFYVLLYSTQSLITLRKLLIAELVIAICQASGFFFL